MVFRLGNPARLTLVVVAFVLFSTLSFFSVRNALAAYRAGLGTAAGYQRAVQLEPGNSEYWYLLGHYWQYTLEQSNPDRALQSYRAALALDPHSSDAWLELATLHESEGRLPEAANAFLEAKRAYPLSAEVSWRYGNFLLRQQRISEAFEEIRRAVYVDPKRSAEAFSRCWRVDPDIRSILDKVIPPDRNGFLDVIRELSQTGQVEPALVVWDRLISINPKLHMNEVMPLTDVLLQRQQWEDSERVWNQAAHLSIDSATVDPPGSLLWDGGFETGVRGGGFAWTFAPSPRGVKANLDTGEKHSGKSSLRLDFDGKRNVKFDSVCHTAVVRPNTPYLVSAWVRARRLTTDQGIRLRLSWRADSRDMDAETADVHGSEPWTQVQLHWASPADIHGLSVCVFRATSGNVDGQIQGTAWVDDVAFTPEPPAQSTP